MEGVYFRPDCLDCVADFCYAFACKLEHNDKESRLGWANNKFGNSSISIKQRVDHFWSGFFAWLFNLICMMHAQVSRDLASIKVAPFLYIMGNDDDVLMVSNAFINLILTGEAIL